MKKYSIITDLSSDVQQDSRFENSILFVTLGKLHFYLREEEKCVQLFGVCCRSPWFWP